MPITKALVEAVRGRIALDPSLSTGSLARELNARESEVVTALPLTMRRKANPDALMIIWERMTAWREPIFSAENGKHSGILASGLPRAEEAGGAIALERLLPVVGKKIPLEDIAQTWFVSRRGADGQDARSVRFFRPDGSELFTVSLGSSGKGGLNPEELAGFEAMREEFGIIPVPRNRCSGCRKCTCGQKKTAA